MGSSEWKEYRLNEVTENHDNKRIPLSSKQRLLKQGKYPYYGAQGIIDYLDEYIFEGEYLLVAEDGANLETRNEDIALLTHKKEKFWVNNHAHILSSNNKSDIRFIKYFLNKTDISGYITGSAQPKLNQANLNSIRVWLPLLKEQKLIAGFLSTIDEKIEINNKINEDLQSISQLLFKHWFIDFEFPNKEGLPYKSSGGEMIDSELGMIPNGWEVKCIGEIAEVIDCLHSKKPERCTEGYPFLQLNNITDNGLLDISDIFLIRKEDYKKWISRVEVSEGDCVITNVGRVGAVSQVPQYIKAAIGRNMTCIRCKTSFLYPTFLIECLLSVKMRKEIEAKTDSGTILNALNVKNISKLRFICPDKESISKFEQTVRPIRKLMELNLEESRRLKSIRDTLLPKLMSGEIDLTNLEINE